MNTNEPTITVNPDTPIEEIIRQLEELGLLKDPEPVEYEFRLYYNEEGTIYASANSAKSAEEYSLTGDYLVVDRKNFENHSRFYVRDGKLVEMKNNSVQSAQLEKSNTGNFTVAKNNAGLLLEPGEEYTNTEKYDYRNR